MHQSHSKELATSFPFEDSCARGADQAGCSRLEPVLPGKLVECLVQLKLPLSWTTRASGPALKIDHVVSRLYCVEEIKRAPVNTIYWTPVRLDHVVVLACYCPFINMPVNDHHQLRAKKKYLRLCTVELNCRT